jgi:tRNA-splicing ligase RtcB
VRVVPEPDQSRPPVIFESEIAPANRQTLAGLCNGVRGIDLAAAPVVLPDFHQKRNMETPSSVAVATRDTIRPTLTSASLNCGMALLALDMDRPGEEAIGTFYERVRTRFPFPRSNRRELSADDVVRCARDGGQFAVDRFDIAPDELDRVEHRGCLEIEQYGDRERIRRELPRLVVQLSRLRFGSIGPSNHFIELQEVEELFDPPTARRLGLEQGQLTLQYHGGGGVLTGELGRLFGRRKDFPRPLRAQMALQKPSHHLMTARSVSQLRTRLELYFGRSCPPVQRHSAEGERLMLANAFAMNYGFAFRLATYASLRRLAAETFGPFTSRLIVDSPHNSIYEESIGGQPALVHRHNASRAFPAALLPEHATFGETGQAILVPGTHRTSSYLCVCADDAERSLYSACHGAGGVIKDFVSRGLSGPDPQRRSTLRFGYSDAAPTADAHYDDRGIDEAVAILARQGVLRPVARLRPFAVLN